MFGSSLSSANASGWKLSHTLRRFAKTNRYLNFRSCFQGLQSINRAVVRLMRETPVKAWFWHLDDDFASSQWFNL